MAKIELPDVKDIFLEYRKMQLLYQSALKEIGTKLEILNDEFKFVHKYNPIEHIESRMKSEESIVRKLMKKGQDITVENIERYIDDVAGIRVICSFTQRLHGQSKTQRVQELSHDCESSDLSLRYSRSNKGRDTDPHGCHGLLGVPGT